MSLLVPVGAFAQPTPLPPPPPGAPAPAPAPPPAPAPAPTGSTPMMAPQPMAPVPPPPNGYAQQPPQQYAAPPTAESLRNGMTFEANLGLGWIRGSVGGNTDTTDLSLGGLDIGVGGWVSPKVALTGRIAGVTDHENGGNVISGVLALSAQYWVDDHIFVGGGLGIGVLATDPDHGDGDSITGFGLDLRAGYAFNTTSENTFNVSLELTPTFLKNNGESGTFTGIALLLGYQHL